MPAWRRQEKGKLFIENFLNLQTTPPCPPLAKGRVWEG